MNSYIDGKLSDRRGEGGNEDFERAHNDFLQECYIEHVDPQNLAECIGQHHARIMRPCRKFDLTQMGHKEVVSFNAAAAMSACRKRATSPRRKLPTPPSFSHQHLQAHPSPSSAHLCATYYDLGPSQGLCTCPSPPRYSPRDMGLRVESAYKATLSPAYILQHVITWPEQLLAQHLKDISCDRTYNRRVRWPSMTSRSKPSSFWLFHPWTLTSTKTTSINTTLKG